MSVASKLVAVMGLVTNLSKDGVMDARAGGYSYLSEEKTTSAMHEAFEKVGLAIMPVRWDKLDERDDTTAGGTILHNVQLLGTFVLIDKDDGDKVEVQAVGEGRDAGDKACNKAMTAAYKYVLWQSCMISRGDDPDHQASEQTTATAHVKSVGCADCGVVIEGKTTQGGKSYTAQQIVAYAVKDFGRPLCSACQWKLKESKKSAAAT